MLSLLIMCCLRSSICRSVTPNSERHHTMRRILATLRRERLVAQRAALEQSAIHCTQGWSKRYNMALAARDSALRTTVGVRRRHHRPTMDVSPKV